MIEKGTTDFRNSIARDNEIKEAIENSVRDIAPPPDLAAVMNEIEAEIFYEILEQKKYPHWTKLRIRYAANMARFINRHQEYFEATMNIEDMFIYGEDGVKSPSTSPEYKILPSLLTAIARYQTMLGIAPPKQSEARHNGGGENGAFSDFLNMKTISSEEAADPNALNERKRKLNLLAR